MALAREIMLQTRIYPRLQADTARQIDVEVLALTLIKISQMAIDLPHIEELSINPLWAGPEGIIALDAKVTLAESQVVNKPHLAIRPYPNELEETVRLANGRQLLLRPILPEDEIPMRNSATEMPPEHLRMRFFRPVREISHAMAVPLTQIDYDREMAFVLCDPGIPGQARLWGGVRAMADPAGDHAEYSVMIHPDMSGLGVGRMLMNKIIDYARRQGIRELWGEVLRENRPMLKLNRELGFTVKPLREDPGVMHVSLDLAAQQENTGAPNPAAG
jgi:acetyltransferase